MDCLKPFQPGVTCGAADGLEPDDLNLRACVAAANKAVLLLQSRLDERNAAAAAAGDEPLVAEEDSDSDGGQALKTHRPFMYSLWLSLVSAPAGHMGGE